jgi:hypothetical protein
MVGDPGMLRPENAKNKPPQAVCFCFAHSLMKGFAFQRSAQNKNAAPKGAAFFAL